MATDEQKLSGEQRELVAVGASVGSGCHPCVDYHLKAGAKAGLGDERLLAAVRSAEHVAAEAAGRVVDHVRGRLGTEVTAPAAAAPLDDALASFGAALGANDLANIGHQMRTAAELGASRAQLEEAIEMAQKVQENAMRIHLREAERLLEASLPAAADEGNSDGCGCDTDAAGVPVDAERTTAPAGEARGGREEVATDQASDRTANSAGSMADLFASAGAGDAAGPSAVMADCRAMLDGACARLAATGDVKEPSAATLTTVGSIKEV